MVAVTSSNVDHETNKVGEPYGPFRETLSNSGESVDTLSREDSNHFFFRNRSHLQASRKTEFVLTVGNGKALCRAATEPTVPEDPQS
jgi:hypothetical protein